VTGSAVLRGRFRLASAAVVGAIVVGNVGNHLLGPPWWGRPLEGGALLVWARLDGLSWAQRGRGRDRVGAGLRWCLGVIGVVAGVYAIGVLLPISRPAFQDARYHLPPGQVLWTAFVVIPLGTVVLEELAFRSVLWGFLSRHARPWQVLVSTSVLLGLWNLLTALAKGSTNRRLTDGDGSGGAGVALATVAITPTGGLVFGELRRRSGSVVASAGAHWAFNALGVLFGLLAWHLAAPAG